MSTFCILGGKGLKSVKNNDERPIPHSADRAESSKGENRESGWVAVLILLNSSIDIEVHSFSSKVYLLESAKADHSLMF